MKFPASFNVSLPFSLLVTMILLAVPLASANAAVTFNHWSSSGPFPAPSKGVVKALAIAPTSPATIYNGSDGGGVYSMSEGETSWAPLNSGLKNRQVQSLAVHPLDPRVLYAATKGGVFKSSDGGISWNGQSGGISSNDVRSLAIDPQTPATVYAATDAGVFKSIDNGTSWTVRNTGISSNVHALLIDPAAANIVYAATDDGVSKTTDGGANWSPAKTGLGNIDVLCLAYAETATAPTLFAGTNGGGVFTSTDGGANWSADNPGGSLPSLVVTAILIDNPSVPGLAYAGTSNGLYKQQYSLGAWGSWAAANTGMATPASVHAIANNPSSRATVYAGADLGAYRSIDSAGAWSAVSTGLRQGRALAVKPTDSTVMVAALDGGGIYRSSDSGDSWIAGIDDPATRFFATTLLYDPSGATVYAGSGNGVFKSLDHGANWTNISASLANTEVRSLAFGSGAALHAGTAEGVFVWDGAGTWAPYVAGQPANSDVTSLAVKGSSLFAGSKGGGVFRSDSGGAWTQINTGLTSTVISAVASDASSVYLGTTAGVFKSSDNGNSWTAANSGITNLAITSVAVSTGTADFMTAGTNGGGVFFSTNGGDVWTAMNSGLSDTTVNALTASATTRKVFAASAGSKIFSLNVSPVSAVTPAAPLASSPADLGRINVSDTKSTMFTLQNTGTLPLKVTSLVLAGTESPRFAIVQGGSRPCVLAALPDLRIEAGDTCTLNVDFTPITAGNQTAFLTVSSDAPNQPVTVYLLGKGGFPPQATITSPANGGTTRNPALISGTAIDKDQSSGANGSGATLSKVQVSTDGGSTWYDATKNPTLNSWTQWSYTWTGTPLPANGAYTVKARATDSNGFIQTSLSTISVTVDNTPPVTTITANPNLLDNSGSGSFSFSVDKPGSSSQCRIDGGASVVCATPFSYSSLSDGSHTFSISSTDPVGNQESPAKSYAWGIDTIPPDADISSAPALFTQSPGATFTFSASEANSSFICAIDGVAAPCSSPKSYSNLADGPHSFTVRAIDPAGNTAGTAPTTQSYSWIVDKNDNPTSTFSAPLAPLSGMNHLFSGTAADPVSGVKIVNVSFNGGSATPAVDAAVSPANNWSSWHYFWALPVNGSYTMQVQAIDNAGNLQLFPVNTSIVVANPLPEVQLGSPANDSLIGSNSPRVVTGTAQAGVGGLPLQKVQVATFLASSPPATPAWMDVNGTTDWNYSWQFPADGTYTVQARALDVATNLSGAVTGNVSQIASRRVTIDTAAPTSTISALSNPYLNGVQIPLSGTADDPAPATGVKQVSISITNEAGLGVSGSAIYNSQGKTWSYTSGTLPDGTYTVQSTVTDNAGNQQANSATAIVTLDNLPPVSAITGKPALLSKLPTAAFSFTANEPAGFTCTLDGNSAPCVCTNGSLSSCTQSYSGLSNGAHAFSVLARDRAGNVETAAKSFSWNIDLVPPTVIGNTPADGSKRVSTAAARITAVFSKDLDPATVNQSTFYLNHGASGVVSYDPATRTATFTPNAPLSYTTTYTVTASTGIADPAGNALAANYTWTFSTDPDGDVNLDGKVDITDALLCLQMAVGLVTPTAQQLGHGDLAPFKNGKPLPDGKIEASDALIILSKVVGKISW